MSNVTEGKRCSLFQQQDGGSEYRNKLKREIQEYLQFLQSNNGDPLIEKTTKAHIPSNNEDFFGSLPDLDNYMKTVTNFLDKHQIIQHNQDHLNTKLDLIVQNLL